MKNRIAIVLAVVGIAGVAAAHEGHKHGAHTMTGTVTAVHADRSHVEMKTTKGEATGFYVDAKTTFLRGKAPSELAALQPGTRVVVEAKTVDNKMLATTVRIGTAAKEAAADKAPAHPAGHQH